MEQCDCVIAGGGPAGIVLALLLARGGVRVSVLEKHGDFLRDFRGDTVHASTVRLMDELGLGPAFRRLPQTRLGAFEMPTATGRITLGDFAGLEPPYNYVAMLPQWDFLNFLVAAARQEPTFSIRMNTEVTDLVEQDGRVSGVTYRSKEGETGEVIAPLVVACDGRDSVLRSAADLTLRQYEVPFDVWWFRLPRADGEGGALASIFPTFKGKDMLLAINREGYYQMAYFVPKGHDGRMRAEGIDSFRQRIAAVRPDLADRVDTLQSMDDVFTLDVKLNHLDRWHRPGLLLIGDAAHAMSPAGGVGINLAIQDAVAAARLLRDPLRSGSVSEADLHRVQRRRAMPTRVIQAMQRMLHDVVFRATFEGRRSGPPPFVLWMLQHLPGLDSLPARLIAFGPRPEHAPNFARRPPAETAS
ncbi:MAG TPA: FAD-dependent oxidoreductase [Devosia sp.]|jgi:2-polyprenyl-6-methoxyphenol hydroxylase-like FAD-dependent oxidoreductase|nr:FAD-dependent oxidoreductase [Devosia sp.]